MTAIYDKKAKKKPTNVSINSDLLEKARFYKINISSTIEKSLERLIKEKEAENWEKENIKAMNKLSSNSR